MTSIQVTAAKLRMSLKEHEEAEEEGAGRGRAQQEALLASRRVYDPDERSVDMSKKRVTDMENCRRITVPDAAEASKESKIQVLIDNLEDVAKKAGREEKSFLRAGSSHLSTMTEQQRRGKASLIRREKNEELVLVASDKSGKLIPMSPELYRQSMEPHIRGDSVHSREDVLKAEKQFNGASKQILRAFKFGEAWGHEDRFVMAAKAENNEVPDLNQLVKDHKPTLKTRPVCRAQVTQAPNGPIAELLCEILNPFVEEADKESRTEVKSQEELCSEMNKVNARIREEGLRRGPYQNEGNLVVGSKDVEAHYPNIDIDLAASEVKKEIEESDLEVNVDTNEVALFLACSMTPEEIEEEGLTDFVNKRRYKNGARPGLTCKAITGGPAVRQQDRAWMQPERIPERAEKMKMIGSMMSVAIKLVMKNHFYSFDNVIRRQEKGGAIGNKLTERLGKILMKRHCRYYVRELARLGLKTELLKCYVDDTTDACVAIDPGVRFENGELVKKEELVEEDMHVAEDERTLNVLSAVANSIFPCVQFTVEYPSKNENGKVPILDLEVAVKDNQLTYEHYEKPCAAKMVIPFSSAHSRKMKMAVLVEEGVRRLRNTARGLDEEKRRSVMEKWSKKLRRSGYPATWRHEVIKAAYEKFDKMCEDEDNGVRPIHRPREWKERERRLEKEAKVTNWHKSRPNQVSAPLILDPTAGSLSKDAKEVCRKFEQVTGMRVVVQERAGNANKALAKSEPLKNEKCGRNDCFPCETGGGKCEKNGAGYEIVCVTCLKAGRKTCYYGESGKNGYTRGGEHRTACRLKNEENALYKHCQLEHGGMQAEFSMKVSGRFSSCLVRQVNEAVRIRMSDDECLMNSKSEFHQAPLVRVVATTGLQDGQEERLDAVRGGGGGRGRRRDHGA